MNSYSHACNCCNENHFVAYRVAALFSLVTIHADGQTIVDRLMASNMGVAEISIHGKAPKGEKVPGYWKGYWILASNDKSIVCTVSDAIVIVSIEALKLAPKIGILI